MTLTYQKNMPNTLDISMDLWYNIIGVVCYAGHFLWYCLWHLDIFHTVELKMPGIILLAGVMVGVCNRHSK